MRGHLTSFTALFEGPDDGEGSVRRVEIPLIQRDYAQGRTEANVDEIRSVFLEVLVGAISGGEPVTLDFVYGKVSAGRFHPLDGQQRLTTLFLLHWYIASRAGESVQGKPWTQFTYGTRASARRFCERLSEVELPSAAGRPSEWIVDQPWYLYLWKDDPTVQAMLVMLDAIHGQFTAKVARGDALSAWQRLTDPVAPAVSFYLLPLDDLYSDEELYIKMNSRGKPLTPFENFKARFEHDIQHSERASEFAQKIDGQWSDLLWPLHGGDFIVDDELLRFFGYVTELCEFKSRTFARGQRIGPRAREVFGSSSERSAEHLEFLFGAFDAWESHEEAVRTFNDVFSTASTSSARYSPERTLIFGGASTDLLKSCVAGFQIGVDQNPAFPRTSGLLLYGVLLHRIHGSPDFRRRVRILRNLIAASEDEIRRHSMPALLDEVEQVVLHGNLDDIVTFSSNQVIDEQAKQRFIDEHPEVAPALFRLEDSNLLRGTLSAFDFDDPEKFARRASAFEAVFTDTGNWSRLTAALLATGDYQRQFRGWVAWQFGTGSSKNESVWRTLLTSGTRDSLAQTRDVLRRLLDELSDTDEGPRDFLDRVAADWLSERERAGHFDWRYYLVKYPSMRSGESGIYYGVDSRMGYMLCMLRKTQRNSLYRDPFLSEVIRSAALGDLVVDPWFRGYETEPRWLTLGSSGIGMRCVDHGYALKLSDDEAVVRHFDDFRRLHDIEQLPDSSFLLSVEQADVGGRSVDSVDRVVVGARLLRSLIAAGF